VNSGVRANQGESSYSRQKRQENSSDRAVGPVRRCAAGPRAEARQRQEKLTEAPGLSPRAIGDLKRVATPYKDTAPLLAEPLQPCYAGYLAGRVQIS